MKKVLNLLTFVALLSFGACSSTSKEDEQKSKEATESASNEADSLLQAAQQANEQTSATVDSLSQKNDSTENAK